jgi:hypothetical protein
VFLLVQVAAEVTMEQVMAEDTVTVEKAQTTTQQLAVLAA